MEAGFQLKSLLQLQLASDASSVAHLPYVLSSLTQDCFVPNAHLVKWSVRINSLLHSKDAGARWAGICIAHKSSIISRSFMIDSAASWLPIVVPMLSRPEPVATSKAAIRLLVTVFTSALEMSEFQRQISLPNVPKCTAAVSNLAATHENVDLKAFCLDTLARLMPIYPNAHRATFANLSSLALSFLNGGYPRATPTPVIEAAARLYSILHLTGGKVGAANLWRKALDDTLAFGWEAFHAVRTTFPSEGRNQAASQAGVDSTISVPLNVDRIRCCSVIIRDMLSTMTTRPVQVPCGHLIKFAIALVSASSEGQADGFIDPTARALEVSVVPSLWKYGCEIIASLANSIPQYLEPTLSKLYTILAFRLEQPISSQQKVHVLAALKALLQKTRFVDTPIAPNRIMGAVLPYLVVILSSSTTADAISTTDAGASKKGKKKAKNYAGDEIFKVTREVICPTEIDAEVVLSALEVVRHCIQNPNLSSSLTSLASRILLSLQLSLSQLSPSVLSPDPQLLRKVQQAVNSICTEIASTSSVSLQKTLPLIVKECVKNGDAEMHASLDLLLHPRLPPVVRPIPSTQDLTLFRAEESEEEASMRKTLGLEFAEGLGGASEDRDAVMQDSTVPPAVNAVPEPGRQHSTTSFFSDPPSGQPAAPTPTPAPVPVAPPTNLTPFASWKPSAVAEPEAAVKVVQTTIQTTTTTSTSTAPARRHVSDDEQDDDEEMPAIVLESDSEEEDEE